ISLIKDHSILEAALQETQGGLCRPIIEPVEEPQSPEVFTALNLARRHLESFEGFSIEYGDAHLKDSVAGHTAVFQRIALIAGLVEVRFGKRVSVAQQNPTLFQVADVRLQPRWIHRH